MLENFLSTHKAISFLGCISQLHFFHFLGSTESMLLAVMGFDRFVAICKPLHYTLIMNHQVCTQMAVTVWIIGFFLCPAALSNDLSLKLLWFQPHPSLLVMLSHCWSWPVGTLSSMSGCSILSQAPLP